jgi:Holliday junction resolvase RusA-like endonuclease
MLVIKINAEGMPLNKAYPSSASGRRFLSKRGSDYKKLVTLITQQELKRSNFTFNPKTQYISTELYFYSPRLFTKDMRISKSKPDTSNLIKLLEDAIFAGLGIDDCYNLDFEKITYNYSSKPVIIAILRTHPVKDKIDKMLVNSDD